MESKAKVKEQFHKEEEADNLYLESIKAKLALLDKYTHIWINKIDYSLKFINLLNRRL